MCVFTILYNLWFLPSKSFSTPPPSSFALLRLPSCRSAALSASQVATLLSPRRSRYGAPLEIRPRSSLGHRKRRRLEFQMCGQYTRMDDGDEITFSCNADEFRSPKNKERERESEERGTSSSPRPSPLRRNWPRHRRQSTLGGERASCASERGTLRRFSPPLPSHRRRRRSRRRVSRAEQLHLAKLHETMNRRGVYDRVKQTIKCEGKLVEEFKIFHLVWFQREREYKESIILTTL